MRLPADGAEAWLCGVGDSYRDPGTRQRLTTLWSRYFATVPAVRKSIEETEWTGESGWVLVHTLEASISIQLGIAGFLPFEDAVDADTRSLLYMHALLFAADAAVLENPEDQLLTPEQLQEMTPTQLAVPAAVRPIIVPLRAQYFLLARPHVEAEIIRRARDAKRGQIGVNVALLMLSETARRLLGGGLPDSSEALARLVKAIAAKNRDLLERLDPNLNTQERRRAESMGRLWDSIPAAWAETDRLELLAMAAQGQLNVIAKAVRNDLLNEVERGAVRERFTVPFPEHPDESTDRHATNAGIESQATGARKPDEEAEALQFIEQLACDPHGRRILQAVMESNSDDDTLKSIAEHLGVSVRTLREWIRRLAPGLRELL